MASKKRKSVTRQAAKKKKRSAKLGSGQAERARKKIRSRRSRLDAAIKAAGG